VAATLGVLGLNLLGWSMVDSKVLSVSLSVSVGLILFVQIAIYRKQRELHERKQRELHEKLRVELRQNYKQVEAMLSMMQFFKLKRPLPPMRNWSISPDLGNIIISTILDTKPRIVVECGSGISTLLTACLLKELGQGKIYSLEHDQEYADITRKNLEAHEILDKAEVIYAPLKEISLQGNTWLWYQNSFIEKITSIDLLIIDGPPGHLQKMARYPAIPMLYSLLSDNATIILDDAKREDEREIVKVWLAEYKNLECEYRDTEKGTAILRKVHSPEDLDSKNSGS